MLTKPAQQEESPLEDKLEFEKIISESSVQSIENELSKYTLNDAHQSTTFDPYLKSPDDSNGPENATLVSPVDSNTASKTNSSVTSISDNLSENFCNTLDQNDGIIHGHIHNFETFTYIHGHIHTNSNEPDQNTELLTFAEKHRRESSHRHSNDEHALQFTDCQHFEFLNCHDSSDNPVIASGGVHCTEDEYCVPKIVEICCDKPHSTNQVPSFHSNISDDIHPTFTERPNSSKLTDGSDKVFEDCNFDDCVDIKCDLDTCNIDELYCKFCEDFDIGHHQKAKFDILSNVVEEESSSGISEDVLQSDSQKLDEDSQLKSCCITSKRKREEECHNHVTHHHLHPNSQLSAHHHHHHIQIHDHHSKRLKSTVVPLANPTDILSENNTINPTTSSSYSGFSKDQESSNSKLELINFEWNFKNQQTKCEWENCSTTLENSFQLQNHIMENHLLQEYPNSLEGPGVFECEWKNCDFSGYDLFSLVNHINVSHGVHPDLNSNHLLKTHESGPNIPTPSSELDIQGEIKKESIASTFTPVPQPIPTIVTKRSRHNSDPEETECHWITSGDDNSSHRCGKQFASAEQLQEHLIQHHVGSGKSEYTCNWEGCSRNSRCFNQRQKVIRHLHVHTRYKPFVCDICKHSFAVETMLEQHMRTHSGEKPYKCKTCGKNFATSSSLSIHVRTHTGEKPLVCKYPGCGKRFSESSNLTKHIKTHEKTYKCERCSRSFSKEKQLISHMTKYHDYKLAEIKIAKNNVLV